MPTTIANTETRARRAPGMIANAAAALAPS